MPRDKATIWCEFLIGDVIDPYCFVKNIGQASTVNGRHYMSMITNFFWLKLDVLDFS